MTADQILALAVQIDEMPAPMRFLELPARPGKQRAVKVERTVSGAWAAWNIGHDNGRIVHCPVEMAERIAAAVTA